GLDPSSDSGVAGDGVVNHTPVNVVGLTLAGAQVALDQDGDGFDDGSATAGGVVYGRNYSLPAGLVPGGNVLRVQAQVSFGQRVVASTQVTLDAVPPVVTGSRAPAANADGWNNSDV